MKHLRLPYSKFGTSVGVNSRIGLALAYTTPYHLVVLAAFLLHFIRRILEILFVNSYSRPTPLRALVPIALLYGGAAASSAFFQVYPSGQPTSSPTFILGIVVFSLGELLNRYHHWLLARLRLPRAAACLAGWPVRAMMSDLLPVWGNALIVSAYLSARANSTIKWYQKEMPLRIPTGWRRLVSIAY